MKSLLKICSSIIISLLIYRVEATANIDLFLQQNRQHFERHVSKNALIIQFEAQISKEEKQQLFNQFSFLQPYNERFETGRNNVVVAKLRHSLSDYNMIKEAMRQLIAMPSVKMVNPVLEQENSNPILILNPVFFSLKQNADMQNIRAFLKEQGIQEAKPHAMLKNIFQFENHKNCKYNNLELAAYLNQHNDVAFAEPNYGLFINACTVNDQYFPRQWNIQNTGSAVQGNGTPGADMDVVNAWTITTGSPDIKVAVLDSGVDTLHPDLQDNLLFGFDATGGNSNGYPHLRFSKDAHGTACAGIIAAPANNMGLGIAGVAYDCKVIPVKIFYYVDSIFGTEPQPYSESQWMADGISWAWQTGNADVMSNSWAVQDLLMQLLPGSPALVDTAIAQAYHYGRNGKGVPMFFSSGNEGGLPYWPGRKPEAIAVNATSMCDEKKDTTSCDNEKLWTGNWKGELELSAPGVRIPTTDISGNNGYANGDYTLNFNGTSAACPNAAAVAALLYSVRDDLEVEDIRYIMGTTADKVGGYDYSTQKYAGAWSEELGYGRVNAYKALMMLEAGYNVGVSKKDNNAALLVFPNPANDNIIQVAVKNGNEKINAITVVSSEGKMVFSEKYNDYNGSNITVSLPESFSAGLYFLSIQTESGRYFKKLVRQ